MTPLRKADWNAHSDPDAAISRSGWTWIGIWAVIILICSGFATLIIKSHEFSEAQAARERTENPIAKICADGSRIIYNVPGDFYWIAHGGKSRRITGTPNNAC